MGGVLPSIAVITQETRLTDLKGRWATAGAARFRLQQVRAHAQALRPTARSKRPAADDAGGGELAEAAASFSEYEDEDLAYRQALEVLRREVELGFPISYVGRAYLPSFDFGRCILVVVLGQDGLVANAAKYVGDLPIVAVNPDPRRFDGVLLPFRVDQIRHAIRRVLDKKARIREITLAEVELNDGQRMLAFNDFFIGRQGHSSARYTLRVGQRAEPQSSSGLIVSTGAGSTGWLSSIFNMTEGFVNWMGGQLAPRIQLGWEDRHLLWVVREPFLSRQSQAELVAGVLEQDEQLIIESLMPRGGVVFSDGIESDFLEFNSGTIARLGVSEQRTRLVVG